MIRPGGHRRRNWVRSFEHVLGLDWLEAAKLGRDNGKEGNTISSAKLCKLVWKLVCF